MVKRHNERIRNTLVAFYVCFYILFKLFFSFSTHPSLVCLYFIFPNFIPQHCLLYLLHLRLFFFVHYYLFSPAQRLFCSLSINLSLSITLFIFHHTHHRFLAQFYLLPVHPQRVPCPSVSLPEYIVIRRKECY